MISKTIMVVSMSMVTLVSTRAQQVSLSPSSIIGGSPTLDDIYNAGSYSATAVVTEPTGSLAEEVNGINTYWLVPGASGGYFVLDLGESYDLSQISLFNTHNGEYYDFGTNAFSITASNSVTFVDSNAGYDLVGGSTILSGNLTFGGPSAPLAENFTSSNGLSTGSSYQYLKFNVVSVFENGGGLNEIRVFGTSAIPEPSSYAAIVGAIAMGGVLARRRRHA